MTMIGSVWPVAATRPDRGHIIPTTSETASCFDSDTWPGELPAPQAWIEFDVDNVETATEELVGRGYSVLVTARTEPWGQIVTRLLGPEGLLVGLTFTPWMRDDASPRRPGPSSRPAERIKQSPARHAS